ncbi:MAG TPA: TonB family protein [Terracidiphilus sp.]
MNTVFGMDWVGRIIDQKFPLLEVLGGSAEGNVFRTEVGDAERRRAAIKLIPGNAGDAEIQLGDWETSAGLSHPHLSRIFAYGRSQVDGADLLYVVTEFPEESLSQVIPERPLSAAEAREMLDPVLRALAYLHGKGLVHGHLKPATILVIQDQVKLSADGISRAGSVRRRYAERDVHTAPEIERGTISPAADVWSLGITLVETLTQKAPAVNKSAITETVLPEHIPQPFSEIAGRCLQADATRRPTVDQIAAMLQPGHGLPEPASEIDAGVPAALNKAEAPNQAAMAKPRPALIAAVAVAVLAILAFLVFRSHKPQAATPVENQATTTVPETAAKSVPQAAARPQAPARASSAGRPASGSTNGSSNSSSNNSNKGEAVSRVQPDVSSGAMRTIRGKVDVKVKVDVDAAGAVSDARLEGRTPSRYFANRAVEAARKWKFKPAQANGQAVASQWILRFEFRKNGTSALPEEVSP